MTDTNEVTREEPTAAYIIYVAVFALAMVAANIDWANIN